MMKRRSHTLIRFILLTIVAFCCALLFSAHAHAEEANSEQSGDGWSMSTDGVMTIERNQGWANCIRDGYKPEVRELVIGKDVTYFRMYRLHYDLPSSDFFDSFEVAGYDKNGEPYYEYGVLNDLFPLKIIVEEGSLAFKVVDGLLINTATNELVLSEMGVTDVVIPEGVKVITRNAFENRDLTSVQFPSSLEVIGEDAFALCANLTEIELPDSIIELRDGAFVRCEQLRQVILPEGLKSIKGSAFSDCNQLMRIDFPEGLESIGNGAFSNCYSLKQVILPDSLKQIGDQVFSDCNLSVLRIPASLTFPVYDRDTRVYIVNPYTKKNKTFGLSSVETVIFSGSDYDFGYPAISHAHNVYFLGKPPEDVGQVLDEN